LHDVSLSFEQGTVMGIVGPNGAGKSTILRIVMGLVAADRGHVEVLGPPMPADQVAAKYRIGFVAEDMRLYESQTIAFHMDFMKSIFHSWDEDYASTLLRRLDLIKEQKVKGLSHGQCRPEDGTSPEPREKGLGQNTCSEERRSVSMAIAKVAGILYVGVWAVFASSAPAQTIVSSTVARDVAALMTEHQLEAFAMQDPEAPNRFLASLLIPGVQMLVVAAEYPAPDELKALLAQKNYRDVYVALHQPVSAPTRFFLIDLACDGLDPKGDAADILYEKGSTQTLFNGDWKTQGLTEAVYKTRFADTERYYSRVLGQLRDALKTSTSGV
jgi:energy-coupling factor transporter ATP-binding protein EcfA2